MKICIDPGHGGTDPGAVSFIWNKEKDINLPIGVMVADIINNCSEHSAIITRRVDRTLSLVARAAFANMYHADLFVSIHANAAATQDVHGIEVFHFPGSVTGREVALRIIHSMGKHFPDHKIRGVKSADFTVLRRTVMPAVLVECEFMTHPTQMDFLKHNQPEIAESIAEALCHEIKLTS